MLWKTQFNLVSFHCDRSSLPLELFLSLRLLFITVIKHKVEIIEMAVELSHAHCLSAQFVPFSCSSDDSGSLHGIHNQKSLILYQISRNPPYLTEESLTDRVSDGEQ